MNTHPNRVVIIGTLDRTSTSESVIQTASALAATLPHAEVHFLHVVERAAMEADARAYVDRVAAEAAGRFPAKVAGHVAVGLARREILQLASDLDADLVVVGASHRKSPTGRWLLGSVSQSVVNDAPCAVLVARPKEWLPAPEILPPCSKCLEVQRASCGETLWCSRHATRHVRGHLHLASAPQESLGGSSVFIRT
jgi:nucleotide-binding universal stress UspA family protein